MFRKFYVFILMLSVIWVSNIYAREDAKLEPLYRAQFTNEHVIIDVKSTGCTRPEHFTLHFKGKGGVHYSVMSIVRDKPDMCRMAPHLISIHLELPGALAALKEPYKVENLFISKGKQ